MMLINLSQLLCCRRLPKFVFSGFDFGTYNTRLIEFVGLADNDYGKLNYVNDDR